jgi:mono/diheme cytochrome c family protein
MRARAISRSLSIARIALFFLCVAVAAAQGADERGKTLYAQKCAVCHGEKGDGHGPAAAALPVKPTNFKDGKFWQGDAATRIGGSIRSGKGKMPAIAMTPDEIRDVTDYMTGTFGPGSK